MRTVLLFGFLILFLDMLLVIHTCLCLAHKMKLQGYKLGVGDDRMYYISCCHRDSSAIHKTIYTNIQKLIYLHLFTYCFMQISHQSSEQLNLLVLDQLLAFYVVTLGGKGWD